MENTVEYNGRVIAMAPKKKEQSIDTVEVNARFETLIRQRDAALNDVVILSGLLAKALNEKAKKENQ